MKTSIIRHVRTALTVAIVLCLCLSLSATALACGTGAMIDDSEYDAPLAATVPSSYGVPGESPTDNESDLAADMPHETALGSSTNAGDKLDLALDTLIDGVGDSEAQEVYCVTIAYVWYDYGQQPVTMGYERFFCQKGEHFDFALAPISEDRRVLNDRISDVIDTDVTFIVWFLPTVYEDTPVLAPVAEEDTTSDGPSRRFT